MSLRTRVRRLLQVAERKGLRLSGCPGCRGRRDQTVWMYVRHGDEGEITRSGDEPAPCRVCGEVPEQVIEVIERIVYTRGEAAAALAAWERVNACPSARA